MGTTSLEEDDTVWIVPGSRVPLIFRKYLSDWDTTGGKQEVELVGACYLHGVMHGEFLLHNAEPMKTLVVL